MRLLVWVLAPLLYFTSFQGDLFHCQELLPRLCANNSTVLSCPGLWKADLSVHLRVHISTQMSRSYLKSTQSELICPQTNSHTILLANSTTIQRVIKDRNLGHLDTSPPSPFMARSHWISLPKRFQLLSLLLYPHFHCLNPQGLVTVSFLQSHTPSPATHTLQFSGSEGSSWNSHLTTSLGWIKSSRVFSAEPGPCSLLDVPSISCHSCLCPNDFSFSDHSEFSLTYELLKALPSTQNALFLSLNMFTPKSSTWSKDASSQEAFLPSSRVV